MSGDSYFRHKVTMEIGTKKRSDTDKLQRSFKDDRELLDYLLQLERLHEQEVSASQRSKSKG